jgi:bacterioferritin-associated ferredoxin
MIVCLCRGISERHIEATVAAGAKTARDVSRACGAATDCGACYRMVAALVEEACNTVGAQRERQ